MREQGESKLQKAVNSLRHDKKVAEIAQALLLFLQSLTYYHVASAPTLDDIAALLESVPRLDASATPTASKKIHHLVPVQSSEDFVGRKEVLADLESRLCLPEKHCRVALVGLGGVGKTRVALQFARKFRKSTKISVFWVYSRSFDRIKKAFEEIAKTVGISGYNAPGVDVLQLVMDWFEDESSGRWLLIIDNADDTELFYPRDASFIRLADMFPRSENGSILLTTRSSIIGHKFNPTDQVIRLPALTTNESKLLLKNRLGPSSLFSTRYKELAKLLECFPLALVQAASFISVNNISVEKYLELYRESDSARIRLLSEDFEDEVRDSQSKNPVATTWSISFEHINKNEPKAAELLSFMSMFDSQAIPESVLPVGQDTILFEKALGALQAFSFISVRQPNWERPQDRCFDFHRLVRLAMRNWLNVNGTFDAWISSAIRNLAALRKSAKPNDLGSQFLPHAVQLLTASINQTNSLHNLERLTIAAQLHYDSNDYFNAAKLQDRAVQGYVKNLGVARSVTLTAMTRLVDIYLFLGRYDEAETYGRLALDTSKAHRGLKHPETISSMSTLSRILRRRSKIWDAKAVATEALQLAEEVFGKASPTYIRRLANFERDFGEDLGDESLWREGLAHPRNIMEPTGNSYSLRALRHFKKQDSFSFDAGPHLPSNAGNLPGFGPRPTSVRG
ncbi:P-loop containing nucleoside triphosphate hydrolase protein [Usnea florida]